MKRNDAKAVFVEFSVLQDMLPFLLILLCVIVAFSTCFYLLGEWSSMSESFFGAYMVMLGEFGLYDEKFENLTGEAETQNSGPKSQSGPESGLIWV